MRALKAVASTFSPSCMSMARRVLPSRPELNKRFGSGTLAPWANVSFTALVYDSPVQRMPSCDQTGPPHFHSSVTCGSASRMSARMRAKASPRQPARLSMRSSISCEAGCSLVVLLFMDPSTPPITLDHERCRQQDEPDDAQQRHALDEVGIHAQQHARDERTQLRLLLAVDEVRDAEDARDHPD